MRRETIGYTYLELAEVVWDSAPRQHLHTEMVRLGVVRRSPRYMRRWFGYRDSYTAYVQKVRDFFQPGNYTFVCAGYPHYEGLGGGEVVDDE